MAGGKNIEWAIVGTRGPARLRAMPHLLIVEALAQLSRAVLAGQLDGNAGAIGYFLGINNAHFRSAASCTVPSRYLTLRYC